VNKYVEQIEVRSCSGNKEINRMKINKNGMAFLLMIGHISLTMTDDKENQGLLDVFLSSMGTLGVACLSSKSCRDEALAAIKKINLKKFAKNILSKIKTSGAAILKKLLIDPNQLPIEDLADLAVKIGLEVPGFSRADLERIAQGDIGNLTNDKLNDLKNQLVDKANVMRDGIVDLAERRIKSMADGTVEKASNLLGVEPEVVKEVFKAAVLSSDDLEATLRNVGRKVDKQIMKKMGVTRAERTPITLNEDLLKNIGDDFDPDGDLDSLFDSAVDELSARETFYHENAVLYTRNGRNGAREVLKDYKDRWIKQRESNKQSTSASDFLKDLKEVMPESIVTIEKNMSASRLENMSVDSLLGSKFGRQTFAERELRSGINEIYEGPLEA
jgi:hypothetical protein